MKTKKSLLALIISITYLTLFNTTPLTAAQVPEDQVDLSKVFFTVKNESDKDVEVTLHGKSGQTATLSVNAGGTAAKELENLKTNGPNGAHLQPAITKIDGNSISVDRPALAPIVILTGQWANGNDVTLALNSKKNKYEATMSLITDPIKLKSNNSSPSSSQILNPVKKEYVKNFTLTIKSITAK